MNNATDIAVTLSADDQALLAVLRDAGADIQRFAAQGKNSLRDLEAAARNNTTVWEQLAGGMKTAFIGGGVAASIITTKNAIVGLTMAMVDAQTQADKVKNSLSFAMGGPQAAKEIEYLREVTDSLGVSFSAVAPMYGRLAAATKGTNLEGRATREIFESIAQASVVMGLSVEESEGAMRALVQMVSKGQIQAEELRGQLGERLPRAFQIFAQSMGVTTAELSKLLEAGKVGPEVLGNFAATLKGELAGSLDEATLRLSANVNRLDNAWLRLKQNVGESGVSSFMSGQMAVLADGMNGVNEATEMARASGEGFFGQFASGSWALAKFLSPLNAVSYSVQSQAEKIKEAEAKLREYENLLAREPAFTFLNSHIDQLRATIILLKAANAEKDKFASVGPSHRQMEDASMAKLAEQRAQQTKELAEIRGKLAGVDKDYLPTLVKLNDAYKAGLMGQTEYVSLVGELAKKNYTAAKSTVHHADAFGEFVKKLNEKIAAQAQELNSGKKISESDKLRIQFAEELGTKYKKLTSAQMLHVNTLLNQLKAGEEQEKTTRRMVAAYQREVEVQSELEAAYVAESKAREQGRLSVDAYIKSIDESNSLLAVEQGLFGQTERNRAIALEQYKVELDLKKQIAAIEANAGFDQPQRDEEITRARAAAASAKSASVAKADLEEMQRLLSSMDSAAHDLFVSIFEDGSSAFKKLGQVLKSSILDLLYKMTVQPFIVQIGAAMMGSGFASAASAATSQAGVSALGSLLGSAGTSALGSFGTTLTGITAGLSQFGTAALASAQSLIGLTGTAAQASTAATMGAAAQTGASTFATTAGTAIPYVAAAVAVAAALGLFRSTKTVGSGIMGTVGETNSVSGYDLNRKSGFLFGGPDYSLASKGLDAATSKTINDAINSISAGSKAYAQALGLGTDALNGFTTTLGSDLIHPDTGGIGIDLTGLTADQAVEKINAELAKVGDAYAQRLIGTFTQVTTSFERQIQEWVMLGGGEGVGFVSRTESGTSTTSTYTPSAFAKEGETASQTLARLASSLVTVNSLFTGMGSTLMATSLAGANMASQLLDAFGGADNATKALGSYYGNFYSEAERTANTTRLLTSTLATLGLTLPTTRDGFRALVDAQDLTTESGRTAYATLVSASDAFAGIVPAATAAAGAAGSVSEAIGTTLAQALESLRNPIRTVEDVAKSLFELEKTGASLRIELMRAQGDTTGADAAQRTLDVAGYTAAEVAVYDYNAALRAQIEAVKAASAAVDAQVAAAAAAYEAGVSSYQSYFDAFGTAEQKRAVALGRVSAALGMDIDTTDEYTRHVDALIQTYGIGSAEVKRATDVAGDFATAFPAVAAAIVTVAEVAETLDAAIARLRASGASRTVDQIAGNMLSLEEQVFQLVHAGDTAALRQRTLAGLSGVADAITGLSERDLQNLVWSLTDTATAANEAAAATQKIASEHGDLSRQLLSALGDTAALRALELDALDPSNRALKQALYNLSDMQASIDSLGREADASASRVATLQQSIAGWVATIAQAGTLLNSIRVAGGGTDNTESTLWASLGTGTPSEQMATAQSLLTMVTQSISADTQAAQQAMTTGAQAAQSAIEAANAAQLKGAQEQLDAAQKMVDFGRQLKDYVAGLRLGDKSALTPSQKLALAQQAYSTSLSGAQAGDAAAMADLQNTASSYLDLAREFDPAAYTGIFSQVTSTLDGFGGSLMTEGQATLAAAQQTLTQIESVSASAATSAEAALIGNVISSDNAAKLATLNDLVSGIAAQAVLQKAADEARLTAEQAHAVAVEEARVTAQSLMVQLQTDSRNVLATLPGVMTQNNAELIAEIRALNDRIATLESTIVATGQAQAQVAIQVGAETTAAVSTAIHSTAIAPALV